MQKESALILFAHGARDPRWAAPFQRLRQMTQDSLPEVSVQLAFLEFMSPSLPELVAQLVADGCRKVSICPVFLGQGGHVLRDLPVMADTLRHSYPDLEVQLAAAIGEDPDVLLAIRDYCLKLV
ncbi:MAG: CbiX/SirB N-terminal domain-containing protein [Burkholderiales bacterium]|nr:CbiX/SirB N-terminal domain-containing protein [Burkholderiales bacterium]